MEKTKQKNRQNVLLLLLLLFFFFTLLIIHSKLKLCAQAFRTKGDDWARHRKIVVWWLDYLHHHPTQDPFRYRWHPAEVKKDKKRQNEPKQTKYDKLKVTES